MPPNGQSGWTSCGWPYLRHIATLGIKWLDTKAPQTPGKTWKNNISKTYQTPISNTNIKNITCFDKLDAIWKYFSTTHQHHSRSAIPVWALSAHWNDHLPHDIRRFVSCRVKMRHLGGEAAIKLQESSQRHSPMGKFISLLIPWVVSCFPLVYVLRWQILAVSQRVIVFFWQ